MKKAIASILAISLMAASFSAVTAGNSDIQENLRNGENIRQMENLDRGTVAVKTSGGVYLSWRLLGTESLENQAFDIYRDGQKIHTTGVHDATCYTDAKGTESSKYVVVPTGESIEGENAVTPWSAGRYSNYGAGSFLRNQASYMDIPVVQPQGGTAKVETKTENTTINYTYSANDASVGDIDNDGQYELVLKWDPSNSEDSGKWNGNFTGNVYLDGYEISSDNKGYLWRIDLGCNIRAGAHYTQFIVYDLDGDGKAEVACKTAPGSKDGKGKYVTEAGDTEEIRNADNSIDYRSAEYGGSMGRIYQGPEYLTIFNGETGEALYTTDYIARGSVSDWGDGGANRSERYLASVAYLNGKTPSLIMTRGYYAKSCAAAYNWDGKKLTRIWLNESTKENFYTVTNADGVREEYNEKSLFAQGNHNLTSSDVDNDGYDEIVFGSAVIDHDGTVLNSTGHGHGDALHVSDFDNDGEQEIFQVHEEGKYYVTYGAELRKGKDASIIQNQGTDNDNGRGVMDNCLDLAEEGKLAQFWSAGVDGLHNFDGTSAGNKPDFTNHLIYWDADLGREMVDGNKLGKQTTSGWKRFAWSSNQTYFPGAMGNNDTKANPCLSADIFGDWREEIIFRTGDNNLRLYMSCIPTEFRLTTLMHDSQYRCAVAWQNVGYNQPPHQSYYIGSASLAKNGSTSLNYLSPATAFDEITYPDTPERTSKPETTVNPNKTPEPKTDSLYERGTSLIPWTNEHIKEWTQDSDSIKLELGADDSVKKGIYYNPTAPAAAYSASKTFNVDKDASAVKYDIVWYYSSAAGSGNYEYVQFGSNLRFGWTDGYKVYLSTNGGTNYGSDYITSGTNRVDYFKNIELEIDLKTNTVTSLIFDGKELEAYRGTSIYNPNSISFGLQRGSKINNWGYPCGLSSIKVTQEVPAAPTAAPTIVPTEIPTMAPTDAPTVPTYTPTMTPTDVPIVPTYTPTMTPTDAPVIPTLKPENTPEVSAPPTDNPNKEYAAYIEDYDFKNKYAIIQCDADVDEAFVIFASYKEGKLSGLKSIKMALENGKTRKLMVSDFENGDMVKVFVWKSLEDIVPLAKSKEFTN